VRGGGRGARCVLGGGVAAGPALPRRRLPPAPPPGLTAAAALSPKQARETKTRQTRQARETRSLGRLSISSCTEADERRFMPSQPHRRLTGRLPAGPRVHMPPQSAAAAPARQPGGDPGRTAAATDGVCGVTDAASQMWRHRCGVTDVASQMWRHRCGVTDAASQVVSAASGSAGLNGRTAAARPGAAAPGRRATGGPEVDACRPGLVARPPRPCRPGQCGGGHGGRAVRRHEAARPSSMCPLPRACAAPLARRAAAPPACAPLLHAGGGPGHLPRRRCGGRAAQSVLR
jgi:hypothetical protein